MLLLSVKHVYGLAVVMFISGLAFAPTMIIVMGLVEQSVPKHLLTEALTWLITGLGVGIAGGAALTEWVVEHLTVDLGFGVAVVAAATVVLLARYQKHHDTRRATQVASD